MSRYAYVEGNPETKNDPSGHCWLACAVIAGLVTAAVVTTGDAAIQFVSNGGHFDQINWGHAASAGLTAGLVVGAAVALGPLAGAAIDAVTTGGGLAEAG